ncbi:MAG: DNA replication and repair protein RecF, partial [bacterium]|nr:DNA replication and repair protein RecF [bacterium]
MLTSLKLTNFRNHVGSAYNFTDLNLIVGPNGSGKTNILEAIALISTTRSWRAKRDSETIRWQQPYARVELDDNTLFIQREPYLKQFQKAGVKRLAKEMIGSVKTVLFEPEDLQLITGSPALRRHWLNVVLAQSDREYGESLLTYRHVILQRNKLLKRIKDGLSQPVELNFWDSEVARLSRDIWQKRAAFLALAKLSLPRHYADISQDDTAVSLRLETHPTDRDRIEDELVAVREREILWGQTVRGPHRDDVIFTMGEIPVKMRASRGEVRSLTLALKLIELDYLSSQKGVEPTTNDVVLLLDDVMSELDRDRRAKLVAAT